MIATFQPSILRGAIDAPPSKSMAHRYLVGAALSGRKCTLCGVDYNEDILATIDCLSALGAEITTDGDVVTVDPCGFMRVDAPVLQCRESGSTLRFLIPLALCLGKTVTLRGSERLLQRPLNAYEELCREHGLSFEHAHDAVTVCGSLAGGHYRMRGDVSSQFITGLIFALVYLNKTSTVEILPPLESRSYVDLTVAALADFGADVSFLDRYTIAIKPSVRHAFSGRIEGDCSSAAFLEAFNHIGSEISIGNLNSETRQGDRVYADYFTQISGGTPTLDISDCPDLGPVLIALAALKNGATLTGTDRLKIKESDRGAAMHEELRRLGGGLILGENRITVPKQTLAFRGEVLDGHNDHRIVMSMSVILSRTGGAIAGAEAIKKSYPSFFEDIQSLGAEVQIK